ncbi:MFS transporter [Streptomyces sp. IBSNAI002]|uniref:MFS transporter n=1 Tax=Streptomyces sp. IBSNAI002 TaxID=3457500 RepID=UPI003FD313FB
MTTHTGSTIERISVRGLAVWGTGALIYFIAVMHGSSLGIAGIEAAGRFHVHASALSSFCLVQVFVYMAMQVPAGMLIDRLGVRLVLLLSLVLLTAGQLGFAFSSSYAEALASRALLGLGDSMTFICVLELGARWLPGRLSPVAAQTAGLLGMAGNLVSTSLLAPLLHSLGWTRTFAGTAVFGAFVLVPLLVLVKNRPKAASRQETSGLAGPAVRNGSLASLRAAWRTPGTKLGMWVSFTAQFSMMVFLLLWGMPFLVKGEGLTRSHASYLLSLLVVSAMICGIVFGSLLTRRKSLRIPVVVAVVVVNIVGWIATIAWPGAHAPLWLLTGLCLALGAGGPAATIGFDYAITANPPEQQGVATGIVNMGGFVAAIIALAVIGTVLDATRNDYRLAFAGVVVIKLGGLVQLVRHRRASASGVPRRKLIRLDRLAPAS